MLLVDIFHLDKKNYEYSEATGKSDGILNLQQSSPFIAQLLS
jgi:hypothetical protein